MLSADRARVYRALAQLFRMPDGESIGEARERNLPELCQALERLAEDSLSAETAASASVDGAELIQEARALCELFAETGLEQLRKGHDLAFDESSSIRCAPTEMDQLDGTPQLELTRTFEMADVGGFYKAFGVELGESGQRVDHITAELEFMNLLAVKEAVALQEEGEGEHAQICRDASRVFLRDHLVRWAPRLGECLAEADGDPIYSAVGRLLGQFIVFDAEKIDAAGAPVHILDPASRKDLPESM
jgi:TorA maturation chaperone TorD